MVFDQKRRGTGGTRAEISRLRLFKVDIMSSHKNYHNLPLSQSLALPQGGTDTVLGDFLSPWGSVRADSFVNESEIFCFKCRHPTKVIPAEKMLDPPSGGGQTLFWGVFSALGGRIRLIPFGMSQKSPASV